MAGKFFDWLDHRTGYRKLLEVLLLEHIPGGAKWRYVWGSCLAFVFSIQLLTGVLLMFHYSPGESTAWGSVYFIQYHMDFGWLIRGLHHFGSQTMVVLLGLHMLQVVIAGAHLPPREINWWLGLGLMGIVLGLGLTGYLLPWDQKGYWATQVATTIAAELPVLGAFLEKIILGGSEYGHHTLTHFYALHVGILPLLLIVLLIAHIAVFRRHGVTVPANAKGEGLFWPDQAFRDMVMCMLVFGVMLCLVVFAGHGNHIERPADAGEPGLYEQIAHAGKDGLGANLDAPADPATKYDPRPEWYFFFLFQLLKYFPGDLKIIATVIVPFGVILLLALLPLLGHGRLRKFGHFVGVLVVVALLSGVALLTFLAWNEDQHNEEYQKAVQVQDALAQRAVQLGEKIPEEGAKYLLRHDPLTQGPKLFMEKCASCHRYSADPLPEVLKEAKGPFKATDLGDWASEKWLRGLLANPAEEKYFGLTNLGGMKSWRAKLEKQRQKSRKRNPERARKEIAEEEADFDLLAKWLADQKNPKPKRHKDWEKPGREAFLNNCASCHTMTLFDPQAKKDVTEGVKDGPDLTDYGSQDWLRLMIMNPGHPLRHKRNNDMPAFRNLVGPGAEVHKLEFAPGNEKTGVIHLGAIEREILIRWLTRDYRVVFGGNPITGPEKK